MNLASEHTEEGSVGSLGSVVKLALQDGWEVYFPAITGDPPQPGVKKVDGFY